MLLRGHQPTGLGPLREHLQFTVPISTFPILSSLPYWSSAPSFHWNYSCYGPQESHLPQTCGPLNFWQHSTQLNPFFLLEILTVPKARSETKTGMQIVYLGKDSRELKRETTKEERKPTQGCVMELAMAVGTWWNQCLIHKTLIYKTLESLTKCASELSAGEIKGEIYPSDLISYSSGVGPSRSTWGGAE